MLRETGPGRRATIRVRHRGSDRTTEGGQTSKIIKEVMASGKAVVSDQGLIMSAPLLDLEGRPLGAIQLDALGSQFGFRREDLDLLTTVAFQISVVLENAILHEAALRERSLEIELKLAQQIQVDLLPSEPPRIAGYEFFDYYCRPSTWAAITTITCRWKAIDWRWSWATCQAKACRPRC